MSVGARICRADSRFCTRLDHAHCRLAALGRGAVGVFGPDALAHARQVRRQGLAHGLAACLLFWCGAVLGSGLQHGKLGLHVGSTGLVEQRALLGQVERRAFAPQAGLCRKFNARESSARPCRRIQGR